MRPTVPESTLWLLEAPVSPRLNFARMQPSLFRLFPQALKLFLQLLQLIVGEIFQIDELIASALQRPDYFVELEMNSLGIAVLGVLNEENHQEGNDGGGGVDDKLPGVRKMKGGAGNDPYQDDQHSAHKGPGAAKHDGGMMRKNAKRVPDQADKVPPWWRFFRFR